MAATEMRKIVVHFSSQLVGFSLQSNIYGVPRVVLSNDSPLHDHYLGWIPFYLSPT